MSGILEKLFSAKKGPSLEELEDNLEESQIKSQIAGHDADRAEKEQVILELKKRYGKNWKATTGASKLSSLPTLKSMLSGLGNPSLTKHMKSAGSKLTVVPETTKMSGDSSTSLKGAMTAQGEKLKDTITSGGDKLRGRGL